MKLIRPTRLRVEASSRCQLGCPLCPIHSGVDRPAVGAGYLKLADFARLLDDNPRIKRVELANYGEIFLNPELLGIVRFGYEKGVALTADEGVNLNTVKREVLRGLVEYQFESLSCSIDGATDATYAEYRVNGDLQRVLANIRTINAFKEESGSPLPRLHWQFVVFGHNEHEIAQAQRLAIEHNMDFRLKLNWDPAFSPVKDEELVRREVGAASVREYRRVFARHYDEPNCYRLWTEPQINWNGAVLGCTRNFWGEFGGNAFVDGLETAVNSPGMRYAREMLLGKKPPRDDIPCATCDIYEFRKANGRWVSRMRVDQPAPYRVARAGYRGARFAYRGGGARPARPAPGGAGPLRGAPVEHGPRLHSRVYPLTIPLPPAVGDGWRNDPVFSGHTRGLSAWSCHVTTQASGVRPHALHSHKEEEILLVLAGTVDVILPEAHGGEGERRVPLRRGQLSYYPAFLAHTVETTSEDPADFLALRWSGYRRTYSPAIMQFKVVDLDFDHAVADGFTSRLVFRASTRYLEALQCHTTVAAPGRGQDVHVDSYDVFHLVLQGEVQTLGKTACTNAVLVHAEGEPHGMFNAGEETAKLLALEFHGLTVGLAGRLLYSSVSLPARAVKTTRRHLKLRTRMRSLRQRARGRD